MNMAELMVGDWVIFSPKERDKGWPGMPDEPHPEKVPMIIRWYGHGDSGLEDPRVTPIPITDKFILKNFEPRIKGLYELTTLWGIRPFHDHWQVCLLTMDEFGGGSWEGAFEVHYVHEVQQFLRLLKVGKEVVL